MKLAKTHILQTMSPRIWLLRVTKQVSITGEWLTLFHHLTRSTPNTHYSLVSKQSAHSTRHCPDFWKRSSTKIRPIIIIQYFKMLGRQNWELSSGSNTTQRIWSTSINTWPLGVKVPRHGYLCIQWKKRQNRGTQKLPCLSTSEGASAINVPNSKLITLKSRDLSYCRICRIPSIVRFRLQA